MHNYSLQKYLFVLARILFVHGPWTSRATRKSRGGHHKQRAEIRHPRAGYFASHQRSHSNKHEPSRHNTSPIAHKEASSATSSPSQNHCYEKLNNHHIVAPTNIPKLVTSAERQWELSDADDELLSRERGSFRLALRRGLSGDLRTSMPNLGDQSPLSSHHHAYATSEQLRKQHCDSVSNMDYVLLASILDRIFFLIYFVINLTSATVIFTRAIP